MPQGTFTDFLNDLRAFESGWDRERYQSGNISEAQLTQWAGGPVAQFFPNYDSWGDLNAAEWDAMSYRSTNSLGFVGYQFGEPLLIDLGYYDDSTFYGAGAATNTWDGTWTGKNSVDSLEEFKTAAAQETAIREAFGYNLEIIEDGLATSGRSLTDFIGTTMSFTENGLTVGVELTLSGILAAAHLRGPWGLLNLLQNGSVSTDEFGTSILQYMRQFGDFEAPRIDDMIAFFETRLTGDEGLGPDTGTDPGVEPPIGEPGPGGTGGTADVDASTADVVVTWAWGSNQVVSNFDPASDTIFVDWLSADDLDVSETSAGVVFSVPSNNQTVTLAGVTLAQLSAANFTFRDASAAREVLAQVRGGTPVAPVDPVDPVDPIDPVDPVDPPAPGRMFMVSLTSISQTIEGFDPAKDMIHIEPGVSDARLQIFEESGNALGTTVRIAVISETGSVQSTLILKGVGLADLSLSNFSIAEQSALNEVTAAIGAEVTPPPAGGNGFPFTYDSDGSAPPKVTGQTAEGGVKYAADTNADDIVGFDPARDQIDFGNSSVHGIIVTKSAAGEVVVDYPWAAAQQVLVGVSFQELGIDGFGVVGNEHLRQDIGGVVSWELGIGPRDADTVYVRSHEYGVHEVIDNFDPATMKLSFLYFGTREQLSVRDTDAGLVISSLPTGQSVTVTGVALSQLTPGRVEFHHDQVMEDNLEAAFGFRQEDVMLVTREGLLTPTAPAGQTTDGFQTQQGLMTPGGGATPPVTPAEPHDHGSHDHGDHDHGGDNPVSPVSGDDPIAITWNWGAQETIGGFDIANDTIDFGTLAAEQVSITEADGDLLVEVLGNGGHVYRLEDIQAEDLSAANLAVADHNDMLDAPGGVIDQLRSLGNMDLVV